MVNKDFTIKNKSGLHARPASDLCALCKGFESNVKITCGVKTVNPRSVVSILMGEMGKGKTITVEIDGVDEERALRELTTFLTNSTSSTSFTEE